jgi:hypothetical protein
MQLSGKVTVECLRRCSRTFLRLFPAICTSNSTLEFSVGSMVGFPWPVSTTPLSAEENSALLSLLARDEYCADCLTARQSPNWKTRITVLAKTYLRCSACNADHPACLFSSRHRQIKASIRVCIGHQGNLRLCEHRTVSWSMVVSEAEIWRRARTPTSEWLSSSHGFSSLMTCMSDSHKRLCGPEPGLVDRFLTLVGDDPDQEYMDKHWWCCPFRPTIRLGFRAGLGVRTALVVKRLWSGHMPLTRRRDGCYDAQELNDGLKQMYRVQGHYTCPQIKPGPVAGERLCDPTRCNCVYYAGLEETRWPRPPVKREGEAVCREHGVLGLGPPGIAHKHQRKEVLGNPGIKGQCYYESSSGIPPFQGCHDLHYADILGCEVESNCVVVSYSSCVVILLDESDRHVGAMDANWYQALDPDSYGLTEDVEGFGVYWCKDRGCKNYYRFARSRLRGMLKPSEYVRAGASHAGE